MTKTVDHTGARLKLGSVGCRAILTIPAGALPEGKVVTISFEVDFEEVGVPGQVAPIARCLPTGLQFKRPATVKIPNFKEQNDEKCNGYALCNEEDVGK